MKKLILPLILAVLGGVVSASAATIVNAKKSAALYTAYVADSVAKHVKDSTAAADSVEKEHKAQAAEEVAAEALMTPADSIREAQNLPTTLKTATHGLPNAADPKHAPAVEPKHGAPLAAGHVPATPSGHDVAPAPAAGRGAAPLAEAVVPRSVVTPRAAPGKLPEVIESGLPENRIAKIFGAMQPKEAAKVLEQMSDSDIRVILGKMSDKQTAAILVAFPAARAAAISKGEAGKPDLHKPEVKADSTKKKEPNGEHK